MNRHADAILKKTAAVLNKAPARSDYRGPVHVGVDLGTAYTVLVVLDSEFQPLAARNRFAQVVRDGLVVDFFGAIELLKTMKAEIEQDLGFALTSAATSYPPGVAQAEVKATRNVLIAAGLECGNFVDEPTAANALLGVENGAVIDVGGGTTGIAIFENGKVVYSADEPTGGTQFSLVIAGALGLSFEEAEDFKKNPKNRQVVQSLVTPVMQKVGAIVRHHITPFNVKALHLVGGTSGMSGMAETISEMTGIAASIPPHPLLVTPIGIAMQDGA